VPCDRTRVVVGGGGVGRPYRTDWGDWEFPLDGREGRLDGMETDGMGWDGGGGIERGAAIAGRRSLRSRRAPALSGRCVWGGGDKTGSCLRPPGARPQICAGPTDERSPRCYSPSCMLRHHLEPGGACAALANERNEQPPPPRSAPIAGVIDDEIESVLDFGRRGSLRAASSGGGDDSTRLLRGGRAEHYITGCYMGFGSGRD